EVPNRTIVFEMHGPFFFGAVETFRDTLDSLAERPNVIILRMRGVPALDSTGIHAIRDVVRRSRRDGTVVLLAEAQPQPLAALTASPAMVEIGVENVVPSMELALGVAHHVRSRSTSGQFRTVR